MRDSDRDLISAGIRLRQGVIAAVLPEVAAICEHHLDAIPSKRVRVQRRTIANLAMTVRRRPTKRTHP